MISVCRSCLAPARFDYCERCETQMMNSVMEPCPLCGRDTVAAMGCQSCSQPIRCNTDARYHESIVSYRVKGRGENTVFVLTKIVAKCVGCERIEWRQYYDCPLAAFTCSACAIKGVDLYEKLFGTTVRAHKTLVGKTVYLARLRCDCGKFVDVNIRNRRDGRYCADCASDPNTLCGAMGRAHISDGADP